MINTIKIKFLSFKGSERSEKALKNILMSFGVKGGGILISLMLVPLTIDYISPLQYGIWLTISSVVTWMNFFDIGLGNGLRNKLATAIANENLDEAKVYVSTTYAALSIISLSLFIVLYVANSFLDWNRYLNIPENLQTNISSVILIVFGSFCLQFIVQLINTVLTATHEPAVAALISFLAQVAVLIAVYVLKYTTPGSLQVLVWAMTLIPVIVFIVASIHLYKFKLKYLAPTFRHIKFKYAKNLMNTGGIFFIIQIGAMLLFQTNNIIITNLMGPQAVTEFNISYKMFSIITMLFTIIITPYWSAFTDAYTKMDYEWMKKTIITIRKVWVLLSIMSIILLLASKTAFHLWVGETIKYNLSLSIAMSLYTIVFMWQALHVYFLNGIGKLKLQLILVVTGAAINIPLSITMCKFFGLTGIITANTIVFIFIGIFCSIQVEKIIHQKAKGIWFK